MKFRVDNSRYSAETDTLTAVAVRLDRSDYFHITLDFSNCSFSIRDASENAEMSQPIYMSAVLHAFVKHFSDAYAECDASASPADAPLTEFEIA